MKSNLPPSYVQVLESSKSHTSAEHNTRTSFYIISGTLRSTAFVPGRNEFTPPKTCEGHSVSISSSKCQPGIKACTVLALRTVTSNCNRRGCKDLCLHHEEGASAFYPAAPSPGQKGLAVRTMWALTLPPSPSTTHKPFLFSKWHSVPSSVRTASGSCLPTAWHVVQSIPRPSQLFYPNTSKAP